MLSIISCYFAAKLPITWFHIVGILLAFCTDIALLALLLCLISLFL